MTINNITKTVMKGFGTGVGGFSNCATTLYAMAAIFDKPAQQEQHDEIMQRIKLLREIVGQEIDRIKGADKPFLPSDWKKYEEILPTDTEEQRQAKYKHNAMVVSKKPYFFRYLYPELNQRLKQFEASYNQISRDMFGIKFKKLLKKENKTDEEVNLVRKYQKYSPLITSNCTMNRLCRELESIDFDIKFAKGDDDSKKAAVSLLPTYDNLYSNDFQPERLAFVRKLYKSYSSRKQMKHLATLFDNLPSAQDNEDYIELKSSVLETMIGDLQAQLADYGMSGEEFLFYCSRLAPLYASFNWSFAWDVLEDQIIKLIPYGKSLCPVKDEAGELYLGARYSLKDVTKSDETSVQKLINSIFGDPNDRIYVDDLTEVSSGVADLTEEGQ